MTEGGDPINQQRSPMTEGGEPINQQRSPMTERGEPINQQRSHMTEGGEPINHFKLFCFPTFRLLTVPDEGYSGNMSMFLL
jgi:hypothetical protein